MSLSLTVPHTDTPSSPPCRGPAAAACAQWCRWSHGHATALIRLKGGGNMHSGVRCPWVRGR